MKKPNILEDLTLVTGEACAIIGSGGKTTLLWYLAGLARQTAPVLVSVTARMFLPSRRLYDRLILNPASYDANAHAPGTVELVAQGIGDRGKLKGIKEEWVGPLTHEGIYFLMEADGSRGLPLKMWHDHEPAVYEGTHLTLGMVPIQILGEPVTPKNVYNWPAFTQATGLAVDAAMTLKAYADIVFHPQGLFKNSSGRKVLIINQADTDELFQRAEQLSQYLARDPRSLELNAIICMSLEELQHENYSHYSCRRIIQANESK